MWWNEWKEKCNDGRSGKKKGTKRVEIVLNVGRGVFLKLAREI
jgi:hypothetical protein